MYEKLSKNGPINGNVDHSLDVMTVLMTSYSRWVALRAYDKCKFTAVRLSQRKEACYRRFLLYIFSMKGLSSYLGMPNGLSNLSCSPYNKSLILL